MEETWKPVKGWEDLYAISTHGRVRRLKDEKILSQYDRRGSKRVALRRGDYRPYVTVPVLMLETFVGPRPPGQRCKHLDGNLANNHLDNLKWATRAEIYKPTSRAQGEKWHEFQAYWALRRPQTTP